VIPDRQASNSPRPSPAGRWCRVRLVVHLAIARGLALVGLAALGASELRAQDPVPPARLNYVNADVRDVIRSLADLLGLNVVLTNVPSRRITFTTTTPVPVAEVGGVLETILESQGLVLVVNGAVAQVLPIEQRPATVAVRVGTELPSPPPLGLISQLVPLSAIRADEAVALLRLVAPPTARIEAVPRSNAVLITDRGVNVARYLDLIRQFDVASTGEAGLRTYVYRLKHASAEELAGTLSELFGIASSGGSGRARVQSLEDRSLSRTLGNLRRRDIDALDARRVYTPLVIAGDPVQARSGDSSSTSAPGVGTTVVPDLATNALVIRTTPSNFAVLRETIEALDVRPPQVLLEVLIAEVSLDKSTEFGVNWSAFTRRVRGGDTTLIDAGHVPGRLNNDSLIARAGDAFLRVVYLNDVDVRAVLRAIGLRSNVRVLSTPHVLALNNEEARILVGSQVPFNQSSRTGLTEVVDRLVQYKDVGTQLTIVPTINDDGYVTVRILQEVSALTTQTLAAALGAPIITTREAETSAIVRDGQTIIIGGLIGDGQEVSESGVPFLKDIPWLGALFRNRFSSRSRTELAIFVTPRVVFTDADADALVDSTRRRLRETEKAFPGRLDSLPDGSGRRLPRVPPPAAPPTRPPATVPPVGPSAAVPPGAAMAPSSAPAAARRTP